MAPLTQSHPVAGTPWPLRALSPILNPGRVQELAPILVTGHVLQPVGLVGTLRLRAARPEKAADEERRETVWSAMEGPKAAPRKR